MASIGRYCPLHFLQNLANHFVRQSFCSRFKAFFVLLQSMGEEEGRHDEDACVKNRRRSRISLLFNFPTMN